MLGLLGPLSGEELNQDEAERLLPSVPSICEPQAGHLAHTLTLQSLTWDLCGLLPSLVSAAPALGQKSWRAAVDDRRVLRDSTGHMPSPCFPIILLFV